MGIYTGKVPNEIGWTHFEVKIDDIRLLNNLYMIHVYIPIVKGIDDLGYPIVHNEGDDIGPLYINRNIFEDRLYSYFLGKDFSRDDVLNLKWNMHISKDFYIKISSEGSITQIPGVQDKWYASYLDVAGTLAEFSFIYKNKHNPKNRE